MNPVVKIIQKYTFPVEINEKGFRTLYNELSKSLEKGQIYFSIVYKDKSSIANIGIEDLINDENRKGREIKEVKIVASDAMRTMNVIMGSTRAVKDEERFFPDVLLEISGPDRQNVFIIQSLIEDRLKSFTASISPKVVKIVFTILWLIPLIVALLSSSFLKKISYVDDKGERSINVLGASLMFIYLVILILGLVWIIDKLFPSLTFLIGNEIERHQRLLERRKQLFWVVGIGLLITVVGIFLSKIL
jgi:hypothetical protein